MSQPKVSRALDRIDLGILDVLQKNGKLSNVNLAKEVNLSPSPCLDRVKRLEKDGFIESYRAVLNAEKLNQGLMAHVQITLAKSTTDVFKDFKKHVLAIPEVAECDMVAGGFDYLLKIRVADMAQYREVLGKLVDIPGVATNYTYMIIEKVKKDAGLLL